MKLKFIKILLLFLAVSINVSAQRIHGRYAKKDTTSKMVKAYVDSIIIYRHRQDSTFATSPNAKPLLKDGRYYRLFAPLTFYHSPAGMALSDNSGSDSILNAVDLALLSVYINRPDLVVGTESQLRKTGSIRNDIDEPIKPKVELTERVEPAPETPQIVPVGVVLKRPNFWTFGGDSYLQFLQNYVSENWYKGGESNYSMIGNVTMTANYNNKRKLKFENKLELKLGFQTSRDDTLHKVKANNDMIRYTGKLGIQATNRWYYSLQLLAYTQFTQGLKSNDKRVYSDFMSPFNLNLGIGMDYSLDTSNKKLKGNINFSFLAFNFLYVDRKDLASRYGVVGDHHTKEDFGSQITADIQWQITDYIKWKTRLYGYTTYKRSLIEWENTVTLNISKYISTNLFIYPRFDDAGSYDENLGYWQFKEYMSLGFSYAF